jgi:hypothetical protein
MTGKLEDCKFWIKVVELAVGQSMRNSSDKTVTPGKSSFLDFPCFLAVAVCQNISRGKFWWSLFPAVISSMK